MCRFLLLPTCGSHPFIECGGCGGFFIHDVASVHQGLPPGFFDLPAPAPAKTHTRAQGCGFSRARVVGFPTGFDYATGFFVYSCGLIQTKTYSTITNLQVSNEGISRRHRTGPCSERGCQSLGVRGVAARGEMSEGTATRAKPDQVDAGTGKFASP